MKHFKKVNGSWKSPDEIAKERVENLFDLRMNHYDSYEDYTSLYTDGVKDGIDYIINIIKEKIANYADDPGCCDALAQRKYGLEIILDKINEGLNK